MGFEIEVSGKEDRTLLLALGALVDESMVRWTDDSFVLTVLDQAALVGIVSRLNDLGLVIERVERTPRRR